MRKSLIFVLLAFAIFSLGCTEETGVNGGPIHGEKEMPANVSALDLETPGEDKVFVWGEVSLLGELFCPCFEIESGGEKIQVWYDLMTEEDGTVLPAVGIEGIENGDKVRVVGTLRVFEAEKPAEIWALNIERVEPEEGESEEDELEGEKVVVEAGDKVKVHYKGTLDDGSEFDSSYGKSPLEFEAGAGRMIKGFDQAVIGMAKGEEKDIRIEPDEAYGQENPALIVSIDRSALPEGPEPAVGNRADVNIGGRIRSGLISEVTEESIKINLNHPMAGKALNFHIEMVEIFKKS